MRSGYVRLKENLRAADGMQAFWSAGRRFEPVHLPPVTRGQRRLGANGSSGLGALIMTG
jgi:hypothetical protein